MQIKPPKFQVPAILEAILAKIQAQLKEISEQDALVIMESYNYLPKNFQDDILYNLNNMIISLLNNMSSQVTSHFLLNFC